MVSIYLIEDCNGLKYIGSTTQKLKYRLSQHKQAKKISKYCSSSKLNLDDCSITELECCNKENRKEREKYWINKTDSVNVFKFNGLDKDKKKEYDKKYREKNKEHIKQYQKQYAVNNKDKRRQYQQNNKDNRKQYNKDKWIEEVVKKCLDDLIKQVEDLN